MEFLEIMSIAEKYMELINPSTNDKVIKIGMKTELNNRTKVIELGSGFGEILAAWGRHFDIIGTGVEIREDACLRARHKLAAQHLDKRIDIVCQPADTFEFQPYSYDVAACIGASFIWNGFRETIRALGKMVRANGRLIIGEPYKYGVGYENFEELQEFYSETELMSIIREEGYELAYVVRSSIDDWDRYQSDNWYGLIKWLEENQDHPDRKQILDFLHKRQENYANYEREHLGWALYSLRKI